ncbi:MAG: hypothetical protein LBG07_01425, partial [Treponema sp.]|nr:hypothetical protein [Treponema sp.]
GEELRGIIERGRGVGEGAPLGAYLWMVLQANGEKLKEIEGMAKSLEKVLESYGFTAKWEARGREEGMEEGMERGLEKGRKDVVKRLQKHGMAPVEIAEALELPLTAVIGYLNAE